MVEKKIHSSDKSHPIPSDFALWQKSLSGRINDILKSSHLASDFQKEHQENFLHYQQKITQILERDDIENNFVYHIPNMTIFLFQNFGSEAQELILSLLKLYEVQTRLRYLGIVWSKKTDLGVKFQKHAQNYPLDERFLLYVLGKKFTSKKYVGKSDDEKKKNLDEYQEKIKKIFLQTGLFREKISQKIDVILELQKTEYLRSLILSSLEHFGELKSISDREWVEFIIKQAGEEKHELQKEIKRRQGRLKKASTPREKNDIQKSIDEIKHDLEKIQDDLSLQDIPIEQFSQEHFEIVDPQDIKKFKTELAHKKAIHDYFGVGHLEDEIIHSLLKKLSRFHMDSSENDKQSALPKDFFSNKTFTCFSGAWAIAALLIKAGFEKENIFIINGFQEQKSYNHAFLVVRKQDGSYMRIDYGFDESRKIKSTKDFDNSLMFYLQLGFNNAGFSKNDTVKGIGEEGRLYKLTDGIMLMYLINLSHIYIDNNDFDHALSILKIVETIDHKNMDYNEAMGIIYYKKNEKQEAYRYFKRSCSLLSHLYVAEYYYENKEYKKAEGGLDYFIHHAKKARE